ncbi:YecA family protein [Veronia pacifica]|uniref:Prepilin peptidase n=1 Tax=Veronia pacifica TaxID=1080227 RepID=A0A1C3EJV4_9GAMM|nr:SEC-C metal-binding domain-containing protein [Veronia pacifica]ODA33521.1 prepilin peptidase [Veronia pacifica]
MSILLEMGEKWEGMPSSFIEGVLLAANMSPAPLSPDNWLPLLITGGVTETSPVSLDDSDKKRVMKQFETQYADLMNGCYRLPDGLKLEEGVTESHQFFAEGFLSVWPIIEPFWQEVSMPDGTRRMLSALMTTMMFLNDEEGTIRQMEQAGLTSLPGPESYYRQLEVMIAEVSVAADHIQHGSGASSVNPYKDVGRNDPCPCGSGKKFKKCCGRG